MRPRAIYFSIIIYPPHRRAKINSRTEGEGRATRREPATFHGATTSREERSEVGLLFCEEEVEKSEY